MSDHEELADRLEEDADRLQHESDQLGEQGESARAAAEEAQQDEYTPAPLGEKDPAYRESPEGEGEGPDAGDGGEDAFDPEDLGAPPQEDSADRED
jgi:hypothetical protein